MAKRVEVDVIIPRVHHYSIEKQVDGRYKIPEGKPFLGPVELILHYQQNVDGFVTQPSIPCDRLSGQSPVAFRGITYHQLEKAMQMEAKKIVREQWCYVLVLVSFWISALLCSLFVLFCRL